MPWLWWKAHTIAFDSHEYLNAVKKRKLRVFIGVPILSANMKYSQEKKSFASRIVSSIFVFSEHEGKLLFRKGMNSDDSAYLFRAINA